MVSPSSRNVTELALSRMRSSSSKRSRTSLGSRTVARPLVNAATNVAVAHSSGRFRKTTAGPV